MTLRTRTRYKLVGSDYSAQQPRMTTFLSGQPVMYEAYNTGKDLYAMIAQSAFNNNYEDNLENYPEGYVVEIDGRQLVSGSGKQWQETVEDTLTIKYYELLETATGDRAAQDFKVGDAILTDAEPLIIKSITREDNKITFTF